MPFVGEHVLWRQADALCKRARPLRMTRSDDEDTHWGGGHPCQLGECPPPRQDPQEGLRLPQRGAGPTSAGGTDRHTDTPRPSPGNPRGAAQARPPPLQPGQWRRRGPSVPGRSWARGRGGGGREGRGGGGARAYFYGRGGRCWARRHGWAGAMGRGVGAAGGAARGVAGRHAGELLLPRPAGHLGAPRLAERRRAPQQLLPGG